MMDVILKYVQKPQLGDHQELKIESIASVAKLKKLIKMKYKIMNKIAINV